MSNRATFSGPIASSLTNRYGCRAVTIGRGRCSCQKCHIVHILSAKINNIPFPPRYGTEFFVLNNFEKSSGKIRYLATFGSDPDPHGFALWETPWIRV